MFSLCDPNNAEYYGSCSHEHDLSCKECFRLACTCDEINSKLADKNVHLTEEQSARLQYDSKGWFSLATESIGVGVVMRSVKRYDLVKIKQRSRKQNFLLRLRFRRLRSSENQFVGVVSRSGRTKPIIKRGNEHRDWFILPLLLPTPTIWFSLGRKRRNRKRSRKKMETF